MWLKGIFKDGDTIIVDIQSPLRYVSLGETKEVFALMYGNILLAQTEGEYHSGEQLRKNEEGLFKGSECEFMPLYRVENETYIVYLNSRRTGEAKDGSSAYE